MTRLSTSIPVPFWRPAHTHPSVCSPIPRLFQPQAVLITPVFSLLCKRPMASSGLFQTPEVVDSIPFLAYGKPRR